MISFRELREQLTDDAIKEILEQFDIEPVDESATAIIFPTCCHNIEGGSSKLYYYKNSKLFFCYTQCNSSFDIFSLLQKIYALRGKTITLRQAVSLCDLDASEVSPLEKSYNVVEDLRYMKSLIDRYIPDIDKLEFKTYDKSILKNFSFDLIGLMPWIQESISIDVMQKFGIAYDSKKNCIIIPNYDIKGNLIGIRGRYFNEEDILKGKYRPIYYNNQLMSHPTGRTFYGIYENQENIKRKKMAIIFEGEKSVLLFGSIYGNNNNIALATLGQNITQDHIKYLTELGVSDVILAYDTDYEDYEELKQVEEKYKSKAKILSPYFNVSYLMDYDFLLPYKSSPIDGGKEIFEKILSNKRMIK